MSQAWSDYYAFILSKELFTQHPYCQGAGKTALKKADVKPDLGSVLSRGSRNQFSIGQRITMLGPVLNALPSSCLVSQWLSLKDPASGLGKLRPGGCEMT